MVSTTDPVVNRFGVVQLKWVFGLTVLDAYAVLAYLRDERAAEAVGELLAEPTVLTVVNAAEVLDQLVRVYGRDADEVHVDLVMLAHTGMQLGEISAEVGLLAGRLRARHYHRERMALSLADGGYLALHINVSAALGFALVLTAVVALTAYLLARSQPGWIQPTG